MNVIVLSGRAPTCKAFGSSCWNTNSKAGHTSQRHRKNSVQLFTLFVNMSEFLARKKTFFFATETHENAGIFRNLLNWPIGTLTALTVSVLLSCLPICSDSFDFKHKYVASLLASSLRPTKGFCLLIYRPRPKVKWMPITSKCTHKCNGIALTDQSASLNSNWVTCTMHFELHILCTRVKKEHRHIRGACGRDGDGDCSNN